MANNWRTRRPSAPNFGMKVPHLWWDSLTSFKVKGSKFKVTRPINADTHRAPYLPNGKAYELQTWRATTRISHRRYDLQGQRSRSQGHVISLSRLGPMCTWVIRGRRAYRVGRTRRPHFVFHSFFVVDLLTVNTLSGVITTRTEAWPGGINWSRCNN